MTELDMTAVVVVLQRLTNEVKRLRDEVQELKGQPKFAMAGGGTPITKAIIDALGIDHGSTTGLLDDDHTQYLPLTGIRAMTGDSIVKNVVPVASVTYSLGSPTKRFTEGYIQHLFATTAIQCGIMACADDLDTAFFLSSGNDILAVVDGNDICYFYPTGLTMEADMVVDCQTNGGELHPARESTAVGDEPDPSVHELFIWRDSTNNKVYLKYNDTDEGAKKVELT